MTDIPNFISAKFEDMKYFKKVTGRPLILFYNFSYEVEYIMKSNYTEEEVVKDNIHYKYNFRIPPSKFEGNISIKSQGNNILLVYPQEIIYGDNDNETFKIMYIMDNDYQANRIRLNQGYQGYYEGELVCNIKNKINVCSVPKSHFDGKQSGNYYTSRDNHVWTQSIYYDSSPIKITKPFELNIIERHQTIYIGNKGKLYFITGYNDTELNVFDDFNIEDNTKFTSSFSCGEQKYSDISCNLWKNTENMVYIFCGLNENLSNNSSNISVDKTKLFIIN